MTRTPINAFRFWLAMKLSALLWRIMPEPDRSNLSLIWRKRMDDWKWAVDQVKEEKKAEGRYVKLDPML